MTQFSNTTFEDRCLRPTDSVVQNVSFSKCSFDNCTVLGAEHPSQRVILRNIEIINSGQRASSIANAAIEDAVISGMGKEGRIPLFAWGAVFKHVTLRGKLSAMKLNRWVAPVPPPSKQQRWDNANKAYYQCVDWALDLREAEFQGSLDLHCLPGSLIRRDPETQVLVKRSSLSDVDWRSLSWGKSSFDLAIQWFLDDGLYDDVVLIASKRTAYFKDDLQAIAMLRSEGIAAYD
jgi:hypothetical protein